MKKAIEAALIRLADEGLQSGDFTLTPDQFDRLLLELAEVRAYGGGKVGSALWLNAPWGMVCIHRGRP